MREIQTALTVFGFEPGPIDGIIGPKTRAAVAAFADKHRPTVVLWNEIAKSEARDVLVASEPSPDVVREPPWMVEARKKLGMHERRDRKGLMAWLRSDGATLGDPAELPWCGDFVETAIRLHLPGEDIPTNPYLAANWMKFGVQVDPQPGAVLVFWRGSPSSWKGHVGFYAGEDETHFHVLGGNQSNAVTISKIAKKRLRKGGVRWPVTGPKALGERRFRDGHRINETTNEE
ncbi:MAG: peptidoglycan-binding protein [Rhodopirellula sp.]|nr:peptidoglycan-binding protein [Rhodopirellula sp.]